ncbi:MAG TPA: M23 family metallopeptidase, partial [Dehalococcoidia bacterium]|nr:M23 family metallopeptidase [Dehalococcoidia bacterium]
MVELGEATPSGRGQIRWEAPNTRRIERAALAYRRILPLLVTGFALMLVSLGDRPAQAEHSLSFPFASLDGWYVQQGYDQGSHSGYERYALDLSRDPDPTNTVVLAPASGTVAWIDPGYGCLSLSLGHDGLHLSICHLKLVPAFATGESVAAGQIIGAVAPAGEAGNNGMPHVHMALYRCIDDTCASSAAGREPVPFAGEHALSGVSFEAGDDHTSKLLAALVADPSVAPEAGIDADPAAPSTSAGELAYPPQELLAGVNPIIYFGPALPPKQAFGNLGDAYVAAFAWDAASQRWLIDVPLLAGEGALTHVQPFGAYWIVTSAPATLEPQTFDEP